MNNDGNVAVLRHEQNTMPAAYQNALARDISVWPATKYDTKLPMQNTCSTLEWENNKTDNRGFVLFLSSFVIRTLNIDRWIRQKGSITLFVLHATWTVPPRNWDFSWSAVDTINHSVFVCFSHFEDRLWRRIFPSCRWLVIVRCVKYLASTCNCQKDLYHLFAIDTMPLSLNSNSNNKSHGRTHF